MAANSSPQIPETLQKLLAAPDLPELGPGPRASVLPLSVLNQKLDEVLSRSGLPAAVHQPIRAAVLLWHDQLDASHQISQELHSADGSYLHGIMHRREPDYGNAKYWFHRVDRHACFQVLAKKARALLESKSEDGLRAELLPDGEWDPYAFVDACERAAKQPASEKLPQLLRAIQAMELELLLERFCEGREGKVGK